MFEHSVKVPKNFKVAANIFKKVSTEGGSVKTLLYDSKLRHFNTNLLYALLTKTIQHAAEIDKIFENCSLFKNEPRFDPWLAKVLTAELLFGKKTLPGKSKPEQTILSYKEQFEKYTTNEQDDKSEANVRRPRYVRINTNLLTTSDAIRAFQDEGYRFIRCTSGSYDDYLKQIQGLTESDFTQDYHVKTVFVFAAGTRLHEHELYLENQIILQDKATALAVHLLAPPPGSVVLDMCAAPGMKTSQVAAYLKNEGKVYAVERNETRYKTLCDFMEKTGSKCVETLHKDALELKRGDYDDVEYILLDPSCSGSGMALSVHNYIEDTRLAKLTSLQEKFLKHAMNAFPNAKRIVYSTCSLFPEENERVITNVVKTSRAKWRVQDVKELLKGQWNNFGSGMYGSMGARCLYARPESDYTTGFFLAVLDRDSKDLEKSRNRSNLDKNVDINGDKRDDSQHEDELKNDESNSNKRKKKNRNSNNDEVTEVDEVIIKKQQKKKKGKHLQEQTAPVGHVTDEMENGLEPSKNYSKNCEINDGSQLINGENIESSPKKKKKKKQKRQGNETENLLEETVLASTNNEPVLVNEENTDIKDSTNPKKKKKKRKKGDNDPEISSQEPTTENIAEEMSCKKKSKKNKRKAPCIEENNEPVLETENQNSSKKNKSHINETGAEGVNMVNQDEPVKKKKKKALIAMKP